MGTEIFVGSVRTMYKIHLSMIGLLKRHPWVSSNKIHILKYLLCLPKILETTGSKVKVQKPHFIFFDFTGVFKPNEMNRICKVFLLLLFRLRKCDLECGRFSLNIKGRTETTVHQLR